ncbi:MAG TPA: nucleotide-binding domain containing protein, partial [Candidatus Binatia bacterium]|nr:nucleotide-binding domain containing protein [Candidatus Binatia bacterium]
AEAAVVEALDWARPKLAAGPVLIHAGAAADQVAAVQAKLGRERAGALIEGALAAIAQGLVASGVRRLVVAGGETSGAVVQGLGVKALRIGPQIDPGVPACLSVGEPHLALALKSGNFGAEDFFLKALDVLK